MLEVSAWLGHASVTTTERAYAFLRVDDLHEAVGTRRGENAVNEIPAISYLSC